MAKKKGMHVILLHRTASQPTIVLFIKLQVRVLNWVTMRTRGCRASSEQLLEEEGPDWDGEGYPNEGEEWAGTKHLLAAVTWHCDHLGYLGLLRLVTSLTGSCHIPDRSPSIQHGLTCLLCQDEERGPASQPPGSLAGGSHSTVEFSEGSSPSCNLHKTLAPKS